MVYEGKSSHIGSGSFGNGLKGWHVKRKIKLAVKKIADFKMNLNEYQILKRLDDPHVVEVLDCWTTNEKGLGRKRCVHYVAMSFVKGKTFEQCREERLFEKNTVSDNVKLVVQLWMAIFHCHSVNVTHRDLKEDNIMLTDEGRVILVDFGLSDMDGTMSTMVGNERWQAPETVTNNKNGKYDYKCMS